MKNNQKGFGAVEGMLLVIIVLLVGFIGYYVYHAQKNTDTSLNNTANTSSKSTDTASSKTNSSSTQYMAISEWGVKLPLSSGITGITYKIDSSDGAQSAAITVPNSECTPMAVIFRGSANDIDPTTQLFGGDGKSFQARNDKQVGGHYYSFMQGNGSTCFSGEQMQSGTAADGVQTQTVYSQLNTAFKNMSAVN